MAKFDGATARPAGEDEGMETFAVVVNEEEQYSIWPVGLALPGGWRTVGTQGSKDHCLSFIKTAWIDIRPLALRKHMNRIAVD